MTVDLMYLGPCPCCNKPNPSMRFVLYGKVKDEWVIWRQYSERALAEAALISMCDLNKNVEFKLEEKSK